MYQNLIDQFFKEHPMKENEIPPSAALTHLQIKLLLNQDVGDSFRDLMNEFIYKEQPLREESVEAEKGEIESATPDELVRIMRRNPDNINQDFLIQRIVDVEDEIIPEILLRLKTSLNSGFIETAARALALCKKDYTDDLLAYYEDVRNPYAQSLILVVLGFRADVMHIPWIVDEYSRLKKLYPNEKYCEGATYALYEMEGRFYGKAK